jgi:transposase-like protein
VLRKQVFSAEQLAAIVRDYRDAGLEPQEVAIMEFAEKLTLHAHAIRAADVEALRTHGLTDEEILDVALAASARNFWSKTMDAMGTEGDLAYLNLEPDVRKAMQRGRPFAEEMICPYCFGTHITKKTRSKDGREEFYCEPCQKHGVIKPKNKYSEAQKLQILEHYERYQPEKIKEAFGVNPVTLARWEKARAKRAGKKPGRAKTGSNG